MINGKYTVCTEILLTRTVLVLSSTGTRTALRVLILLLQNTIYVSDTAGINDAQQLLVTLQRLHTSDRS